MRVERGKVDVEDLHPPASAGVKRVRAGQQTLVPRRGAGEPGRARSRRCSRAAAAAPAPAPERGAAVVLERVVGHGRRCAPTAPARTAGCASAERLPVGTTVDAQDGRVRLTVARDDRGGDLERGLLRGQVHRDAAGAGRAGDDAQAHRPDVPRRPAATRPPRGSASASACAGCGATATAASARPATTPPPPCAARSGSPRTAATGRSRASCAATVEVEDFTDPPPRPRRRRRASRCRTPRPRPRRRPRRRRRPRARSWCPPAARTWPAPER